MKNIKACQFQQPDASNPKPENYWYRPVEPAMPNPTFRPGTVIIQRGYYVDENGALWLMDPEEGTVDYLELDDD